MSAIEDRVEDIDEDRSDDVIRVEDRVDIIEDLMKIELNQLMIKLMN